LDQRTRRMVGVGCALVLLVVLGAGGVYLVKNVPAVARVMYGDPATATPVPTLRATFTPFLSTVTLTPNPTSTRPMATSTSTPQATPTLALTAGAGKATRGPTEPVPSPSATPTIESPTPTPRPPTATAVPKRHWIAFETKRKNRSDYEIFVMTPDGSQLTNLTNSWADDVAPVWSPDGRRIAFVSFRDTAAGKWGMGPGSIYVMDFDPQTGTAGNVTRVTGKDIDAGWPTWSPDGKRIAFQSEKAGNWDIWTIGVDGSGPANLTKDPSDDQYPAWSPDGTRIAFTSRRSGNQDVWIMNADGSGAVNLTRSPGRDRYPMWSPDGKRFSFNTSRDGNQEIYVMNADGSNQRNVSLSPDSIEGMADWSPDGKRLVFYSNRPGNKDVFILDLGGGAWINITADPASDEFCTWSP
jgi:Tol biopolymer transport system component